MTRSQIYTEPYGPKARERLAVLVADAKSSDPLAPVTVIVPTQYAGLSLRRTLSGDKGLLNVRFMVLARLAEYLGAPTMAAQGKTPLTPLVELAAIRSISDDLDNDGLLGGVADHPSLHLSLRDTFRDLGHLNKSDLDRLAQKDSLRAETVESYRRFRKGVRDYYGGEELAEAAAGAIGSGQAKSTLRDLGVVVFFLVQEFTPGQLAMTQALGEANRSAVVLGLTGESDADKGATLTATRLSKQFTLAPSGDAHDHDIRVDGILSASDVREETRWVARRVLALARESVPFHRMAILYRQAVPYASQLQTELGMAGIPMAGPDPTLLRDTPAGRFLLGLLDVVESDFSRNSLMQWIAETPVRAGRDSGLASAELPRWDELSRKAGVIRGIDQWLERVGRYKAALDERAASVAELDEVSKGQIAAMQGSSGRASRLFAFVQGLGNRLPPTGQAKWHEFSNWASGILKDYVHNPDDWPAGHVASYERVLDLVSETAKLDRVESGTTLAGFRQALEGALEAPSGRTGVTGSGVFVANLASAQGMEFETVWILGMADGVFPTKATENPLLPDMLRREVGDGKTLSTSRSSLRDERRLFLAALATGNRRYLSYSRTDSTAQRGQHPSPWLLDAATVLNGGQRVSYLKLTRLRVQWLSIVESPEHALQDAAAFGAADEHDFDLSSIATERRAGGRLDRHPLARGANPLARAVSMEQARWAEALTPWDGYVGSMTGASDRLTRAATAVMSPTRLERWATCPARFFLSDVLSLSAQETPEEVMTISSLDKGTLIHTILERFVKEAEPPLHGKPWPPRSTSRLLAIADEEFVKTESGEVTGRAQLWEAEKADILRDLETFIDKDAEWRAERGVSPREAEWGFGFDSDPVPLLLPDGSQVRFRGMIDRVDIDEDGSNALVIDYKTGSSYSYRDMNDDPLGQGKHLQLPVYAHVVRTTLAPDAAVDAEYWFVSSKGKFERRTVPLNQVEEEFKSMVQTIVAGIREGVFPANPGVPGMDGPANCTFCDFNRLCPTDRVSQWARKQNSPEATPYVKLTHIGDNSNSEDAS
jgi:ATP-dependent helicase/nuclease subunit B